MSTLLIICLGTVAAGAVLVPLAELAGHALSEWLSR